MNPIDVIAEINRLRPNYQSGSMLDAGRRQMLDHFEQFATYRIVGPADMEKAAGTAPADFYLLLRAHVDDGGNIQSDRLARISRELAALVSPHMPVPAGLVEFAKEMCRVGFDGGSIDGCDILDTAVEHGLCTVAQYHPSMTGVANREYLEEGDAVYVFSGPLASRPKGGA